MMKTDKGTRAGTEKVGLEERWPGGTGRPSGELPCCFRGNGGGV